MTILSYRGPGSPGGVSGTLSRVFDEYSSARQRWWHLSDNRLMLRKSQSLRPVCVIPSNIINGHYRFCNNFLWPVLHDMPEHACFSPKDRVLYGQFNLAFALNVLHEQRLSAPTRYFVQDYQLALTPTILSNNPANNSSVFWHVPWPKSVQQAHVAVLSEIAAALLSATQVGFHIAEYAENFMHFVETHLPDYSVNPGRKQITERTAAGLRSTNIVVQPLGLDLQYWKTALESSVQDCGLQNLLKQIGPVEYVLSVDRADYTKGVFERLAAIRQFFTMYPEWQGKISFLQVCQRTREGLDAFDKYWDNCAALASEINSSWAEKDWKPVVWISEPVSPMALAKLYSGARAMLVNPLRDGLNLTAKEFIACAGENAGTLLLSDGAGVWHEFGEHAVRVRPENPQEMAASVLTGLSVSLEERQARCRMLREKLQRNSLREWWQRFGLPQAANEDKEPPKRAWSRELTVA